MPPRQKASTEEPVSPCTHELLSKHQLVHLVVNGRTLQFREILDWDDKFLKVRSDVHVAPQTEIALYPWHSIEAIGITDER